LDADNIPQPLLPSRYFRPALARLLGLRRDCLRCGRRSWLVLPFARVSLAEGGAAVVSVCLVCFGGLRLGRRAA
jgi:hypothetical protein